MNNFDRIRCLAKLSNTQNRLGLEFFDALPGFSKPSFETIIPDTTMTPTGMEGVYPFLLSNKDNPDSWMLGNISMSKEAYVSVDKVKEGSVPLSSGVLHVFSIVNSASSSWGTGISDYPPRSTTDSGLAAGRGALADGSKAIAIGEYASASGNLAIAIAGRAKTEAITIGGEAQARYSIALGPVKATANHEFNTNHFSYLGLKWVPDSHGGFFTARTGENDEDTVWTPVLGSGFAHFSGEAIFDYSEYRSEETLILRIEFGVLKDGSSYPPILYQRVEQLYAGNAAPRVDIEITPEGIKVLPASASAPTYTDNDVYWIPRAQFTEDMGAEALDNGIWRGFNESDLMFDGQDTTVANKMRVGSQIYNIVRIRIGGTSYAITPLSGADEGKGDIEAPPEVLANNGGSDVEMGLLNPNRGGGGSAPQTGGFTHNTYGYPPLGSLVLQCRTHGSHINFY